MIVPRGTHAEPTTARQLTAQGPLGAVLSLRGRRDGMYQYETLKRMLLAVCDPDHTGDTYFFDPCSWARESITLPSFVIVIRMLPSSSLAKFTSMPNPFNASPLPIR